MKIKNISERTAEERTKIMLGYDTPSTRGVAAEVYNRSTGEIISQHRTIAAAQRVAKNNSHLSVHIF